MMCDHSIDHSVGWSTALPLREYHSTIHQGIPPKNHLPSIHQDFGCGANAHTDEGAMTLVLQEFSLLGRRCPDRISGAKRKGQGQSKDARRQAVRSGPGLLRAKKKMATSDVWEVWEDIMWETSWSMFKGDNSCEPFVTHLLKKFLQKGKGGQGALCFRPKPRMRIQPGLWNLVSFALVWSQ